MYIIYPTSAVISMARVLCRGNEHLHLPLQQVANWKLYTMKTRFPEQLPLIQARRIVHCASCRRRTPPRPRWRKSRTARTSSPPPRCSSGTASTRLTRMARMPSRSGCGSCRSPGGVRCLPEGIVGMTASPPASFDWAGFTPCIPAIHVYNQSGTRSSRFPYSAYSTRELLSLSLPCELSTKRKGQPT